MRDTVTISLSADLRKVLDSISKDEGLSRSDVFREALSDYAFWKKFKKQRSYGLMKAAEAGIYSDEDVFKIIS